MRKLLSSQFGRLKKDRTFWILAAFMGVYAVALCLGVYRNMRLDETVISFDPVFFSAYGLTGYLAVPGIVMAVFCSLFVGAEFSDGTIRNKLIVGRTRHQIYLSNFLVCAAAGLAFNAAHLVFACALGIPLFGGLTLAGKFLLPLILGGVLMYVSYAAVFTLLAMVLQNKAVTAIVCLVATVVVMFLSIYMISMIAQPEYYDWVEFVDGEAVTNTVRNTHYLTDVQRAVYQFVIDLLPSGQSLQISGMSAPNLWRLPLLSLCVILGSNLLGTLAFRRRDLK